VVFWPTDWYDATHLLGRGISKAALVRVRLDGSSATVEEIASYRGDRPMLSPDGKLLALMSADDILVQTVDGGTRTRIGRGADPVWLDNGTVVYRDEKTWFKARVDSHAGAVGPSQVWFTDPQSSDTLLRSHALTPDGAMIYMRTDGRNTASFLRVIPRWTDELAAAVAAQAR
jgi:hypothetical protein